MVTEWSKGFDRVSVEEMAFSPRRAANVAAAILEMLEAGLEASFYYHIWDQVCYARDFAPFFSERGIAGMLRHWNEVPHRFGLFGVSGEVRPQYFVYQMLSRLGDERVTAHSDDHAIRVLAGYAGIGGSDTLTTMLVNFSLDASRPSLPGSKGSHSTASTRSVGGPTRLWSLLPSSDAKSIRVLSSPVRSFVRRTA
jgi:hypothetical protein